MLFEQDGYKTFGEKMLVVSCCKFVPSQALALGNICIWGIWTTSEVWDIHKNALFKSFVAFLWKDGQKWRENLKEI